MSLSILVFRVFERHVQYSITVLAVDCILQYLEEHLFSLQKFGGGVCQDLGQGVCWLGIGV